MAPQVWRDVDELLQYMGRNWPFDLNDPFGEKKISVNASVPGGDTPLHFVAAWDDVRGIELLVEAGAEVDACGDMSYTPLATAVSRGNAAAARALLLRGASPHVITEFGHTPYQVAMREGSEQLKAVFRDSAI